MPDYYSGIIQARLRDVTKAARTAVGKGLDKTARDAQQKLDAVVSTWVNKPAFEIYSRDTGYKQIREVSIYGNKKAVAIWFYVDKGTKPHIIRPKKPGGRLRFGSQFAPKTAFRAKFGGAGKSGGKPVYRQLVRHPGTKARDFSGAYKEDAQKQVRTEIIRELSKRL
jgi:hypothetical protein